MKKNIDCNSIAIWPEEIWVMLIPLIPIEFFFSLRNWYRDWLGCHRWFAGDRPVKPTNAIY
jgi:hypothetical protein